MDQIEEAALRKSGRVATDIKPHLQSAVSWLGPERQSRMQ